MAQQVTDLSKLTDEQLGVYRDLLAKKQQPAAPAEKPAKGTPLEEALSPTGGPDSFWTSPHGLIRTGLRGMAQGARRIMTPGERVAGVNDLIEGAGRTLAPAAIPLAIANPATAAAGLVGGLVAQKGGEGAASLLHADPETQRLVGNVGTLAAGPLLSKGIGAGARKLAPSLVKSALRLPGNAEAYGADPAGAVLRETSGIRPSTIARTGQQKITDLTQQLDTAAANSSATPSLTPARNILKRESVSAASANSEQTPREIARMSKQLTDVRPGFAGRTGFAQGAHTPITFQRQAGMVPGPPRLIRGVSPEPIVSAEQPAKEFLGMKRQFDDDFIRNWNPTADTKHGLGIARQAYGAMADELNRTVPGAEGLNKRIQGLIPAVNRAEAVSRNAGALERAMDRISRPTGALVPALIGREIGGTSGLLAGLGAPEMISAPATKMAAARSLFSAGKPMPFGKRSLLASPVLMTNGRRVQPAESLQR